jgi:hypothetical protein
MSTIPRALLVLALCGTAFAEPVVYPSKGQSDAQRSKDELACHEWAQKETGVDPVALAEQQQQQQGQGSGTEGSAARGAGIGAMRGAMDGDAGAGAMHGAGMGRLIAMVRARRQLKQQQSANEQSSSQMEQYDKAYATCLTGRGYAVTP